MKDSSGCQALGYRICWVLAHLWHENTPVKSLKTPSCCPVKPKLYTWAKGMPPVKEWTATALGSACSCTQVSIPRQSKRDVACAWQPGTAFCTSAGAGAAADTSSILGTTEIFWEVPECKEIGVLCFCQRFCYNHSLNVDFWQWSIANASQEKRRVEK